MKKTYREMVEYEYAPVVAEMAGGECAVVAELGGCECVAAAEAKGCERGAVEEAQNLEARGAISCGDPC